jgi:hypothetical protein
MGLREVPIDPKILLQIDDEFSFLFKSVGHESGLRPHPASLCSATLWYGWTSQAQKENSFLRGSSFFSSISSKHRTGSQRSTKAELATAIIVRR